MPAFNQSRVGLSNFLRHLVCAAFSKFRATQKFQARYPRYSLDPLLKDPDSTDHRTNSSMSANNRQVGEYLKTLLSAQEVPGSIHKPVKSDEVSASLPCFFEAMLPRRQAAEMDPATRRTLRCNTAPEYKQLPHPLLRWTISRIRVESHRSLFASLLRITETKYVQMSEWEGRMSLEQ